MRGHSCDPTKAWALKRLLTSPLFQLYSASENQNGKKERRENSKIEMYQDLKV